MFVPEASSVAVSACQLVRQDIPLFDFRNGRGSAGDLYSLANNSAKYRASEWRDIGYSTPCGFCFILTNNAECLRPAVSAPHGYCGPELYFTFIGRWFDDFCGRSSCNPVSKFALGSRHRCPVVFSYRGFVCCFETAKCPLDRSKPFGRYVIGMCRHRSIRQVVNLVLNFLNERAAHVLSIRLCAHQYATCGQHRNVRTCSLVSAGGPLLWR
jgi:hypothetical protein